MRKILQLSLLSFLFLAMGMTSAIAQQKIAYVDSDAILSELPAKKQMDVELQNYREQLQKALASQEEELRTYVSGIAQRAQKGELSPLQQQQEEAKIQQKQQALQAKALEADQNLAKKEQELSKPIIDKFNAALKSVAAAKGFTYIVDKKLFLFLDGGIDATADVKAAM